MHLLPGIHPCLWALFAEAVSPAGTSPVMCFLCQGNPRTSLDAELHCVRIQNSMKSVIVFFWVKNVLSDFVDFVIHDLKLWVLSYRKYTPWFSTGSYSDNTWFNYTYFKSSICLGGKDFMLVPRGGKQDRDIGWVSNLRWLSFRRNSIIEGNGLKIQSRIILWLEAKCRKVVFKFEVSDAALHWGLLQEKWGVRSWTSQVSFPRAEAVSVRREMKCTWCCWIFPVRLTTLGLFGLGMGRFLFLPKHRVAPQHTHTLCRKRAQLQHWDPSSHQTIKSFQLHLHVCELWLL